jgi:hypothetical protein
MVNRFMAAVHSIGRRQRDPAFWIARYSNYSAASSVGRLPRVLITLRKERLMLSTVVVVQITFRIGPCD